MFGVHRPSLLHALSRPLLFGVVSIGIVTAIAAGTSGVVATAGAPATADADPLTLVRKGQVGGTTLALDTGGQHLYFGVGPRLMVANVDDPAVPRKIAETEPLGDLVRDVVVDDDRAVVAVGAAGVVVVDIEDPALPTVVARMDTPGYAWAVAIRGRLFVADGPGGLRVVEFEGGRLREVGSLKLAAHALRVAANEGFAYVVVDTPQRHEAGFTAGRIQVVDVGQPGEPRLIETDDSALSPFSVVAVEGDLLLAAGGWTDAWFTVFDLSDPGRPMQLGRLDVARSLPVNSISVDGTRVVLAHGEVHPTEGWLTLVDISDPANPGEMAYVNASSRGLQAVALYGPQLAVALPEGGIATYNVTNPQRPVASGTLEAGFEASMSVVSGETAYVAAGTAGLGVVDAVSPHVPVLEGLYRGDRGGPITYYGNVALRPSTASAPRYAYVTTQHLDVASTALRAFDLASGGGPSEVAASYERSTWYGALDATESHAFVVGGCFGGEPLLRAFDFATAITLTLAATMTLETPCDIELLDGYAYVADSDYGLRTIDVRDPTAPTQVVGLEALGSPVSVSVTDRHVLAAGRLTSTDNRGGLAVFDRVDPSQPQLISTLELPEWTESVAAGDRWACVGFNGERERFWPVQLSAPQSKSSGIYLINLDDPARPFVARRMLLPGAALGITADDDRVYVSMAGGGLFIIDVETYIRRLIYLPAAEAPGTGIHQMRQLRQPGRYAPARRPFLSDPVPPR